MTDPTGVTPGVTGYKLQRDEVVKVAGTPFKRLLVYKLEVALPLPPEGVTLFAIQKDFVINSITTAATDPFENDADYIMYDVADGEVIGIVEVRGTQSQVNSTVVTVKDNIVVYNNGEIGSGVTSRYSGFQVDRGDLADVRFVWDEQNSKFVAGEVGHEIPMATESYVTSAVQAVQAGVSSLTISSVSGLQAALDGKSATTHVHANVTDTAAGFMSSSDKVKLDGIAAGANLYVHPVSGITAGTYKSVTVDANGHITAGSNPTTVAGYGITDAVTTGGNSLPMSHGDMSSSTLVANGTTPGQVVSAVSSTLYRTVKYLVQISAGADFHSSEIIAMHNGTTALATEYASIMTGNPLATFDVDLSGGSIRLLATPTVAGATFKVIRTAIAA